MVAESDRDILMKYWDHRVSIDGHYLRLRMDNQLRVRNLSIVRNNAGDVVSGFYASYREGVVVLFRCEEKVYFGIDSRVFDLNKVSNISWGSSIWGRHFQIKFLDQRNSEIFRYKTLWRDVISLSGILQDLWDEDWGLNADMPSFIHSFFNDGTLADKLDLLIEREVKEMPA